MEAPAPPETAPPEPTAHLSASTPDGRLYGDASRFEAEMDRLYLRSWLNVAREEDLARSGDFLTRSIGRESLLFVRDSDGMIRGFYNLCRHRGTRLIEPPNGTGLRSIVCPYHAWTYGLDGRLQGASFTQKLADFDKRDFGLYPVHVDRWGGFVWANLDPAAPGLREDLGRFFQRYERYPIGELRRGAHREYTVEANWKIIVENYSECYHCAPVHPSLNRLTPYDSGGNDSYFITSGPGGNFAGGHMEFAGDFTSMVRSGYTKRPPLRGMTAADQRRVSYHVLFPNFFFSLHPDYLMTHRTWPVSPERSVVENDFYFEPDQLSRPDFDPNDAVDLWDEINRQDWHVCELAQKGSTSRMWTGGRYSEDEPLVCDFDLYVKARMGD